MKIIKREILSGEEKEVLRELWNEEYPARLNCEAMQDFELYLNGLLNTEHYLLVDGTNKIFGWAYTFLRKEENWFAILLHSKIQGKGNGTRLINILKSGNDYLNGWVIDKEFEIKQDGSYYKSPLAFYLKNDFEIWKDIRIENEKMSGVKIMWKR
jgi:GNAT superfamily N-acetyltransferase